MEFLLCTLTPEVQCRLVHRNHVIWRTKITKFWWNGNDSKQPYWDDIEKYSNWVISIASWPKFIHINRSHLVYAWMSNLLYTTSSTYMIFFLKSSIWSCECCLMPSEQFFNYIMTRTSCFLMTWWWCLFCTLRPKSLVEFLTFRKHLSSPLVFGVVRVSHLFSFLCCHFTLFVFVLCLVYPILPVTLHCPFLICPFGFL